MVGGEAIFGRSDGSVQVKEITGYSSGGFTDLVDYVSDTSLTVDNNIVTVRAARHQ